MCFVSTPISRALLRTIRPSALSGRRLTQAALRPRRATPAATVSSEPPTLTFRLVACSSLWKSGGLSRSMVSPKVTTSVIRSLPWNCQSRQGVPSGRHTDQDGKPPGYLVRPSARPADGEIPRARRPYELKRVRAGRRERVAGGAALFLRPTPG